MTELVKRWSEWLRWACLALAVLVVVIFLVAQRQSTTVSYGESPSDRAPIKEGSANELSDATVPPVSTMNNLVTLDPVVRLPGSIAHWDPARVRAEGGPDVRILVAPPGLDEAERKRVGDVEGATITVTGLRVSGDMVTAVPDSAAGWRAQYATGDVTNQIVAVLAAEADHPTPSDPDSVRRRAPTAAETDRVAADLRRTGVHIAPGATLTEVPKKAAASAFPGGALVVALPMQPYGKPMPSYGPALAKLFPGKAIVVLYGSWVEYSGPNAAQFADVATASFYGQFGDRLGKYAYPQDNVLYAYLNRVTDVRYAGLFDRPLPYKPFDPLKVTLPALPWVFAVCAAVFLALSARSVLRPGHRRSPAKGLAARAAGLTTLAIELSGLTGRGEDASLARGIAALESARDALRDKGSDRQVRTMLDNAEAELDEVARRLGRADYRPATYLRARLA